MFELFVTLTTLGVIAFFVWLIVAAIQKIIRQRKERKYYKTQQDLIKKEVNK